MHYAYHGAAPHANPGKADASAEEAARNTQDARPLSSLAINSPRMHKVISSTSRPSRHQHLPSHGGQLFWLKYTGSSWERRAVNQGPGSRSQQLIMMQSRRGIQPVRPSPPTVIRIYPTSVKARDAQYSTARPPGGFNSPICRAGRLTMPIFLSLQPAARSWPVPPILFASAARLMPCLPRPRSMHSRNQGLGLQPTESQETQEGQAKPSCSPV